METLGRHISHFQPLTLMYKFYIVYIRDVLEDVLALPAATRAAHHGPVADVVGGHDACIEVGQQTGQHLGRAVTGHQSAHIGVRLQVHISAVGGEDHILWRLYKSHTVVWWNKRSHTNKHTQRGL
ncbi:hypothetical protein ElyMa_002619800 [Elysia marginata]|uniref:Uncharacterized protein n=1 Tax=Elysia marginata TaxID=1093978 RepID=A0AAV4H605_9GAST|nr:hypothetical protein ElyMa_002619800 [Elysia marginata]